MYDVCAITLAWNKQTYPCEQVLEEALLPFLSGFPTSRLKLITMYIEQRGARDQRDRAAKGVANESKGGVGGVGGSKMSPVMLTPIR